MTFSSSLQEGRTLIGTDEASCSRDIGESELLYGLLSSELLAGKYPSSQLKGFKCALLSDGAAVLHGPGVLGEHCVLENLAGTVTLIPKDAALCSVNGSAVTGPSQLSQGKNFKAGADAQGGDGQL